VIAVTHLSMAKRMLVSRIDALDFAWLDRQKKSRDGMPRQTNSLGVTV